jgi:hypothetical protein
MSKVIVFIIFYLFYIVFTNFKRVRKKRGGFLRFFSAIAEELLFPVGVPYCYHGEYTFIIFIDLSSQISSSMISLSLMRDSTSAVSSQTL